VATQKNKPGMPTSFSAAGLVVSEDTHHGGVIQEREAIFIE